MSHAYSVISSAPPYTIARSYSIRFLYRALERAYQLGDLDLVADLVPVIKSKEGI